MIDSNDIKLLDDCLAYAREKGASALRLTLTENDQQLVGVLDGEIDKISMSMDRSLGISMFADGRFGTFSTNLITRAGVFSMIDKALEMTRMMAPDPQRRLPEKSRKVTTALSGTEMGLLDCSIDTLTADSRREMALSSALWVRKNDFEKGFSVISEEGEYSDSISDTVTVDSEGLFCRHRETSFEIGYETTVEDSSGNRFSAYWWDASPSLDGILPALKDCSAEAILRAAGQIGPRSIPSGKYNVVFENECASRLLNPILTALGGYSIQQGNSFLAGKAGEKVFGSNFSVIDRPAEVGKYGSKLYDSEGVATRTMPIVEEGVVRNYFLNTYIAGKMGVSPTIEDVTRPSVAPFGGCPDLDAILSAVGRGILVTGFNGGNNNSTSGDFSYGIEGFLFEGGKRVHPVREIVLTGNFRDLWNSLIFSGEDPRKAMTRQIPTVAFKDLYISA